MNEEEHSKNYWKIKEFYDKGLWSKTRVVNVCNKGIITKNECNGIVGKIKKEE